MTPLAAARVLFGCTLQRCLLFQKGAGRERFIFPGLSTACQCGRWDGRETFSAWGGFKERKGTTNKRPSSETGRLTGDAAAGRWPTWEGWMETSPLGPGGPQEEVTRSCWTKSQRKGPTSKHTVNGEMSESLLFLLCFFTKWKCFLF